MLPTGRIAGIMLDDAAAIVAAVRREKRRIAQAAELVAKSFKAGGRVVFVGAGTSGRLGVLEAAELPPTFGIAPRRAVAIMAGGSAAVGRAREGVEDDARAGAAAMRRLRLSGRDVVVAISASGVTPFVRAAVAAAVHSHIIGITCDPGSPLRRAADVCIVLRTGPEIISGSTRLKAGTATKIALNTITTTAMIRIGKTYGNLMVDVRITSAKLRDRAIRILSTVTGLDAAAASALLARAGGHVKTAIVMHDAHLSKAAAAARLTRAGDSLRAALASRQ